MSRPVGLEKCLSFISCHVKPLVVVKPGGRKLSITLSRQTGSGGHSIAEKLAVCLQERTGSEACPWTVFDRQLMKVALEEHDLPARMAESLPEDRVSELEDVVQELLGAQPSSWSLVPQVTETVLKFADLGYAIIVGRGANVITARLKHVFHVRLVGSLEVRIERVMTNLRMSRKKAMEFIAREDRGRKRYLRKHFQVNIDDPLIYHMTLNTDRLDIDTAARVIADASLDYAAQVKDAR